LAKSSAKATLHNVASVAGVSIATASKALNGLPVSADNKAKVLKVAARLGYVVNETARALRSNRSNTVGLIFNELKSIRGIGVVDAMSAALESSGHSLVFATARSDARNYDTLMRRFLERRVDGLICVMPPTQLPSVRDYAAAGIPIVVVTEPSAAPPEQSSVHPSSDAAVRAALTAVFEFGHRRMLSLDDGSSNFSLNRIDPEWRRRIAIEQMRLQDAGSLDRLVHNVLAQQDRPTLIIAYEAQAEALLAVCKALEVAIPQDLSIVALTQSANEERAAQLNLSSVYLRSEVLGAEAVKQMVALLNGERSHKRVSVEVGSWHARESTGRAPELAKFARAIDD